MLQLSSFYRSVLQGDLAHSCQVLFKPMGEREVLTVEGLVSA